MSERDQSIAAKIARIDERTENMLHVMEEMKADNAAKAVKISALERWRDQKDGAAKLLLLQGSAIGAGLMLIIELIRNWRKP